jgi:hypothetical protein
MPYRYSGKTLRVGKSWKDNDGVMHPASWATAWTAEEKAAKGIVWEDDPAPFDNRFYWSAGVEKALEDKAEVDEDGQPILDEDGVQLITKGLKSQAIARVKAQAGGLLAPTDWMVIKAAEVADYTVPENALVYRAAVRSKSNEIETAINACGTIEELIALHSATVDAEGNIVSNALITDWPEVI